MSGYAVRRRHSAIISVDFLVSTHYCVPQTVLSIAQISIDEIKNNKYFFMVNDRLFIYSILI